MEHSAEGLICNIKPESKSQEGLRKWEGLEEYKRQREKEFANRLYILVMLEAVFVKSHQHDVQM